MSYADIKSKRRGSNLITDGMRQLHTDELLQQRLTVTDVDMTSTKNGRCGIMLFEEYPNCFYFAGKVLQELCEDFLSDEEAMEELRMGNVHIVISTALSQTGRSYATFDYVD